MAIWHALAGESPRADSARPAASAWRPALLIVAAIYLTMLVVYRDTALSLYEMWTSSNLYGHGMLVLPATIFLLGLRRERLRALQPQPSAVGLGMIGLSAVLWLLGEAASINLLRHLALVSMLPGVFVTILGLRIARASALPLAYLLFAVPAGGELIPVLQDFTGAAVASILVLTGIPALLDANFLVVPSGQFEIAEACAGARFLIAAVAVAIFGSDILFRRIWKRAAFIAAAIAIAVTGNAIRAYLIIALADWRGLEAGIAFDHVTYGLVFLGAVLVTLFAIGWSFKDDMPTPLPAQPLPGPAAVRHSRAKPAAFAAVAGLAAAAPYLALLSSAPAGIAENVSLQAPASSGAWRAAGPAEPLWRPDIAGADGDFTQRYVSPAGAITLYAVYFEYQRQGGEVVQEGHRYAGGGPWREGANTGMSLDLSGQTLQVPCAIIADGATQRLACHFYWVNGRLTGSALAAKLQQVTARLGLGSRPAAVIGFSVARETDPAQARQVAENLLRSLPAVAQWFRNPAATR